jgi:hypothetical protein
VNYDTSDIYGRQAPGKLLQINYGLKEIIAFQLEIYVLKKPFLCRQALRVHPSDIAAQHGHVPLLAHFRQPAASRLAGCHPLFCGAEHGFCRLLLAAKNALPSSVINLYRIFSLTEAVSAGGSGAESLSAWIGLWMILTVAI